MANKLPNATAGMTFPRPKPDTPPSMVKKIGKTTYLARPARGRGLRAPREHAVVAVIFMPHRVLRVGRSFAHYHEEIPMGEHPTAAVPVKAEPVRAE